MKVLLIEDDSAMRTTLQRTLERRGMQVHTCEDGHKALDRWRASQPDVVLLDLTLPGRDGLQVLEMAREDGQTAPVIVLTARSTIGDRIIGLNLGADDYLSKPFDLDELEARIRALLRRSGNRHSSGMPGTVIDSGHQFAGLYVDPVSGAVHHHQTILDLPPREVAMLRALLQRPGHAVAKERLFESVFPGELDIQPEAIEVVAYRLRKRLSGLGVQLVTLRGLGYLLKAAS